MLLGLRTAIYHTPDIVAGKRWYTQVLGQAPYFDQPFYVGFNVAGYELGLTPDAPQVSAGAYWGVADIRAVYARLLEFGAAPRTEVQDVGESILTAEVLDPWGNVFGLIQNPHFKA
jgi:predicted enzyme related to lactoylglutathione lyase